MFEHIKKNEIIDEPDGVFREIACQIIAYNPEQTPNRPMSTIRRIDYFESIKDENDGEFWEDLQNIPKNLFPENFFKDLKVEVSYAKDGNLVAQVVSYSHYTTDDNYVTIRNIMNFISLLDERTSFRREEDRFVTVEEDADTFLDQYPVYKEKIKYIMDKVCEE